jgi:hypothetical protein
MKTLQFPRFAAVAACGLLALASACAEEAAPATFCRFVPERSDDFAWENDKVAFRAYGPALRSGTENGGVDCWLKRVSYPIINKWYKEDKEGKPYHTDHGEGFDPYHVGSTLGCGGIGLWLDGRLVTSETFVSWRVIQCEPDESVFELDYAWEHDGHKYTETKRCTIKLGDRLFNTVATFRKDGEPAANLPVAIGISTHDGKAAADSDVKKGWLACWEEIGGAGLGTGVTIDPARIRDFKDIRSDKADGSHALFLCQTDDKGQISWWAGYGWERAGEIKTPGEWKRYLADFAKKH